MKEKLRVLRAYCKQSLPILLSVLIFVVIMQYLSLMDYALSIVKAMLPFVMGAILAFLFQPLVDRLHHKYSYKASVRIVYLGVLCILIVLLLILLPILYQQIIELMIYVPNVVSTIQNWLQPYIKDTDMLLKFSQTYITEGSNAVIKMLQNTLQTFTFYAIAYITAFFISSDIAFFKRVCKKIAPSIQTFETFYLTMSNIVYQYIKGTCIDLLFISITTSIVLVIFRFPNWLMYAVLLALFNLFPYIGATIGLVVIGFAGLIHFEQFPWIAFGTIWLLQQLEANFIQPMIFNKTMNVRPLLNFVFLFIGEALFGIPGVIFSPILAAIAQIAFRSWLHARVKHTVGDWNDIWVDFDVAMEQEKKMYDVS